MSISDRLRRAIDAAGINQSELSRRVDVSRTMVHLWVAGKNPLTVKHARSVARVLGVDAAWLLFGTGDMKTGAAISGGAIVPRIPMLQVPSYRIGRFEPQDMARTQFACSDDARSSREMEECIGMASGHYC